MKQIRAKTANRANRNQNSESSKAKPKQRIKQSEAKTTNQAKQSQIVFASYSMTQNARVTI
jgi:hypothetical protein